MKTPVRRQFPFGFTTPTKSESPLPKKAQTIVKKQTTPPKMSIRSTADTSRSKKSFPVKAKVQQTKIPIHPRSKAIHKALPVAPPIYRQSLIDGLFSSTEKSPFRQTVDEPDYDTPNRRKALKQSKIRVQGPKIRLFAESDSDAQTYNKHKKSASKQSKKRTSLR